MTGMYPIDDWAPSPEVPNQERIFAAAAELQEAYERDEEWTRGKPLSEAMVLFTLTAVEDGLRAIMDKWMGEWAVGNRMSPFPDMHQAVDEIIRIVSKEGKEEYEASLREKESGS